MADDRAYQYDLFVSYAAADQAWAEGYLLPALGLPEERLITTTSFTLGASLVGQFERAITTSRYTVLVLTPAYLADDWAQFSEELASFATVADARERLIPLVKESVELPLRIDFRVRLDCTDQASWEFAVSRLRALLEAPEPQRERLSCPYPGMAPFGVDDTRTFFGRSKEIEQLLQRLRLRRRQFVIGPSGSGKSSLVFAGLIPRLIGTQQSPLFEEGFWLVRDMRPGGSPMEMLARALSGDPRQGAQAAAALIAADPRADRLLLVVDQLEEVFTQAEPVERSDFLAALATVWGREDCVVLLTMRADFYPELMSSELWPLEDGERIEIAPLRGDGLRQAILQPARDRGVYLEAGLVERLVLDATGQPGALPLLQETMVLLWSRMERRLLTLGSYDELGQDGRSGLAVAIADRADVALVELPTELERNVARRIFLRLVQFAEGRPDIRRQQTRERLRAAGEDQSTVDRVLQHLAARRLLTLGGGEGGTESYVDIAHEALITGWPILQRWIADRREAELTRRRLEEKTAEWQRLGRAGGWLDAAELAEVERWLSSPDAVDLGASDPELRALVDASRERLEEEAGRQRDLEAATAAVDLQRAGDAVISRFEAGGEQLDALKAAVRAAEGLQELFAAVQSADDYPTVSPIAALYTILERIRERHIITTPAPEIRDAALSPDGLMVALVDGDEFSVGRNLVVVRRVAGEELERWELPTGNFAEIRFTTDGDHLISIRPIHLGERAPRGSDWAIGVQVRELDGRPVGRELRARSFVEVPRSNLLACVGLENDACLCDPAGNVLVRFGSANEPIQKLRFSPDGTRIVTAGDDGYLRIWGLDGQQDGTMGGVEPQLAYVTFCQSTNRVLGVGQGGNVWVWDRSEESLLTWESGLRGNVTATPSGSSLAGMDGERRIRIWSSEGEAQAQFLAHDGRVVAIQFSLDGSQLVTTGVDGVVQFRDLRGALLFELGGHAGRIKRLTTTRDGQQALTLDMDSVVRIWDVRERRTPHLDSRHGKVLDVVSTNEGFMTAGADGNVRHWQFPETLIAEWSVCDGSPDALAMARLSRDRQHLIGGRGDSVSLWSLGDGEPGRERSFEAMNPLDASLSLDNRYVVVAEAGGRVRLCDFSTRERVDLPRLRGWTYSVRFDQEGKCFVTVGADGMVRVWDLTCTLVSEFPSAHGQVLDADFGTDDRIAFACADGVLLVCNRRGEVITQCFGHTGRVLSVRCSPDGRRLASLGVDGTVRLWDLFGRQLARSRSYLSPSATEASGGDFGSPGLAFSSDQQYLAVPGDGGVVRLHEIGGLDSLLERARSWLANVPARTHGQRA